MLILNEDKEDLLVDKYKFKKEHTVTGEAYYNYQKCLTIYSFSHRYEGKINVYSGSKALQDILFDLIKDDILIKVPNFNKDEKIFKLKTRIRDLEKQIELLEK